MQEKDDFEECNRHECEGCEHNQVCKHDGNYSFKLWNGAQTVTKGKGEVQELGKIICPLLHCYECACEEQDDFSKCDIAKKILESGYVRKSAIKEEIEKRLSEAVYNTCGEDKLSLSSMEIKEILNDVLGGEKG